jgi:hypothetical protein
MIVHGSSFPRASEAFAFRKTRMDLASRASIALRTVRNPVTLLSVHDALHETRRAVLAADAPFVSTHELVAGQDLEKFLATDQP